MNADAHISVPFSAASWLVQHNLNQLWSQSHDVEIAEFLKQQPCCPDCCGPCEALRTLDREGLLDKLAEPGKGEPPDDGIDGWWDFDENRVSRTWLAASWHTPEQCDNHPPEGGHG